MQSEAAAGAADPGGRLGGPRPGLLLLHVDGLVDWQVLHVEVCPAPGQLGGQLSGEASPRYISLLGHIIAQHKVHTNNTKYVFCRLTITGMVHNYANQTCQMVRLETSGSSSSALLIPAVCGVEWWGGNQSTPRPAPPLAR